MKTKYIGLDVHKDSISVAIANGTAGQEVRFYGKISSKLEAIKKLMGKLSKDGSHLKFCYEAGPTGYKICRQIRDAGYECMVVAPSMIPRKAGERVKTDRRDALTLARLFRAGELTGIKVPEEDLEALRDLSRGREDFKEQQRIARQRLLSFLLRHGIVYEGKNWSQAHMNWLAKQSFSNPAQHIIFEEYIQSIQQTTERIARIEKQMEEIEISQPLKAQIKAYQSLRGISLVTAVGLTAELGDLTRFESPRQIMSFVGLVPSESSSGETTKRGGITNTGNTHARRFLVESSWSYRHPAKVSERLKKRLDGQSAEIKEISWKAQERLCRRYRRLTRKGKPTQVAVTAVARELTGFLWELNHNVAS